MVAYAYGLRHVQHPARKANGRETRPSVETSMTSLDLEAEFSLSIACNLPSPAFPKSRHRDSQFTERESMAYFVKRKENTNATCY
jgi:hypothetical protein